MRGAVIIALGVAVAAFASMGRRGVSAQVGFNYIGDWTPNGVSAPQTAQIANMSISPNAPILFRSYVGKAKLTDADARALIADLDASVFGGWFARNVPTTDIVGVWRHESGLKPAAENKSDPMGGAFGLGQVLADVARIDYGVTPPQKLFNAETGARVSMAHIKSTIERLQGQGVSPVFSAWAQAYNVGVAGYVKGRRNPAYLAAVSIRKIA